METSQSQMVIMMKKPKEVKGMGRVGLESFNLEVWGKPPKDMIFELRTVKEQITTRLGDKGIPSISTQMQWRDLCTMSEG